MPNADWIGLTSLPMPKPLEVEDLMSRESILSAGGQLKQSERSVSKDETRKTLSEGVVMSTNKEMLTQMVETVSSGMYNNPLKDWEMETIFQDMGVFYEEVVAMIGNEKKPSCALKYSKLTPY